MPAQYDTYFIDRINSGVLILLPTTGRSAGPSAQNAPNDVFSNIFEPWSSLGLPGTSWSLNRAPCRILCPECSKRCVFEHFLLLGLPGAPRDVLVPKPGALQDPVQNTPNCVFSNIFELWGSLGLSGMSWNLNRAPCRTLCPECSKRYVFEHFRALGLPGALLAAPGCS